MAMLKKGSRLLTVDDVRYRWRVRHKPTYFFYEFWQPDGIAYRKQQGLPELVRPE